MVSIAPSGLLIAVAGGFFLPLHGYAVSYA